VLHFPVLHFAAHVCFVLYFLVLHIQSVPFDDDDNDNDDNDDANAGDTDAMRRCGNETAP